MASGVTANDECLSAYQELKLGKKMKYIVYALSPDNKEIVVEKRGTNGDYETFLGDLPEDQCRYAVYDVEYDTDAGKRTKLCFYIWSPDGAKIKNKMLYASSKDALRRSLVGISTEIQGSDIGEVSYENVVEKLQRLSR